MQVAVARPGPVVGDNCSCARSWCNGLTSPAVALTIPSACVLVSDAFLLVIAASTSIVTNTAVRIEYGVCFALVDGTAAVL